MNRKWKVMRKLGHVAVIYVYRLPQTSTLNLKRQLLISLLTCVVAVFVVLKILNPLLIAGASPVILHCSMFIFHRFSREIKTKTRLKRTCSFRHLGRAMYGYIPGHGWDIFHSEPSFMAAWYVSMVQFYSLRTSTLKNYNPNLVFRVIVKQVLLYEIFCFRAFA